MIVSYLLVDTHERFCKQMTTPYPTRVFETWRWSVNRPQHVILLTTLMDRYCIRCECENGAIRSTQERVDTKQGRVQETSLLWLLITAWADGEVTHQASMKRNLFQNLIKRWVPVYGIVLKHRGRWTSDRTLQSTGEFLPPEQLKNCQVRSQQYETEYRPVPSHCSFPA